MRSRISSRAAALPVAVLAITTLTSPIVRAHAVIVDSIPAAGAVIAPGDSDIKLRYNSRIDHQRSRLTLISGDGMANGLAILPDSAPDVLAAKAPDLAPGQYRLRWQVLAIDGHLTRGDIPFSVKTP